MKHGEIREITFRGSYDANSSKFATEANGGAMPWWGSQSLVSQFAAQVGASLGTPNAEVFKDPYYSYEASMGGGPGFAYD